MEGLSLEELCLESTEYLVAKEELELAMQYFNYAIEDEHIDNAIAAINIAEKKLLQLSFSDTGIKALYDTISVI